MWLIPRSPTPSWVGIEGSSQVSSMGQSRVDIRAAPEWMLKSNNWYCVWPRRTRIGAMTALWGPWRISATRYPIKRLAIFCNPMISRPHLQQQRPHSVRAAADRAAEGDAGAGAAEAPRGQVGAEAGRPRHVRDAPEDRVRASTAGSAAASSRRWSLGTDPVRTAMERTVGLPTGIGTE
jgi:hypothetical protein